ncbi:MAG: mannosyltransferase [Rhodococcus sp. (in: high G+C Gram-positive bacteria)]
MSSVPPEQVTRTRGGAAMHALLRWSPLLLALSVLARMAWTLSSPNGMNLVDLHVYVDGSAALAKGSLYDFTYSEVTPDFPLPFTYPPFAALVFFPLHFIPFPVLGVCWQLLTILALYALARMSLSLLLGDAARAPHWRAVAVLWTTVGVWIEPVRTTLDYGQINVFLALLVMTAVRSSRWWLSGALVGIAAGIKLTPAITGLYFLLQRRWTTALFSAVAFAATVGVSYLLIGSEAREYFSHLLGDADRIGPVGSVWNQSLRGALSRLLGYDVETGVFWLAAVAVTVVLAAFAARTLARDDRLGTLVIVELVGLLVSPISWSHHWVWVIPMLIWMLHGPYGKLPATRILAGYWLVTTLIGVPWVLSFFQDSIWLISRPAVLAWLGAVDVAGAFGVFVLVIYAGRRAADAPEGPSSARSEHRSVKRDPDPAA